MKKLGIVLAVIVLALAVGTTFAALPGSGWNTNVQVQNVGSATANVVMTSYSGGSSVTAPGTITVPVGGSTTILASQMGIGTGYNGAGVISSDQPLFGILFITNYDGGGINQASAIVRAANSENTATRLNFPLAKRNFGASKKTTTFYIQNAGSASTNITATISVLSGGPCTTNPKSYANVPASEQINFTPQDLGCPAGTLGSLSVASSGQALAGVVLEHDDSVASPAGATKVVQGTRGFTPADGDTTLLAPIIKKSFGASQNVTGLQVQNVSGAQIPAGGLVITYTVVAGPAGQPAGTVVVETNSAPINDLASFNSLHPGLQSGVLASAVVRVVDPAHRIIGIVNENRPSGSTTFRNTTYSMLAQHEAATNVSLPLVKEYFGASGGRCTGVQIATVGGAAQLELTYKATSGQTYVITTNSATTSKTFNRLSTGGTTGISVSGGALNTMGAKNYGVTAKSLTPGVKIVAIANEVSCTTRSEDDANYEGFALP
jgi:hypothetical protein